MPKINIIFAATLAVVILAANAFASKKGAATGAIIGAAAGLFTEQKIKEIESRDFFEDDNVKLTTNDIILKPSEGSEPVILTFKDKNSIVISQAIKQLNATIARQTSKWENLSGTFELEGWDVTGHLNFVSDKHASIFVEKDGDTTYIVNLVSVAPGALDYIKSFVLNNVIFVAIVLFAILGAFLPWLKKKISGTKKEQ